MTTTPSGSTASRATPSAPIIQSRPILGVPKRVRTIAGMPATIPATTPTIPASRVIHDSDSPWNRVSDPATRHTVAITVQALGAPIWTSTA